MDENPGANLAEINRHDLYDWDDVCNLIHRQEDEIARLREALTFYAAAYGGERARKALGIE